MPGAVELARLSGAGDRARDEFIENARGRGIDGGRSDC